MFDWPSVAVSRGLPGCGYDSRDADHQDVFTTDSLRKLFFAMVAVVGEIHCRVVGPYKKWPWPLVRLVDNRIAASQKQAIARKFFNAKECCLDSFFSQRLQQMAACPEDLLEGGSLHNVVNILSLMKVMNIEVEDNFARASQARQASAGQSC